jgi:hypothetical protein
MPPTRAAARKIASGLACAIHFSVASRQIKFPSVHGKNLAVFRRKAPHNGGSREARMAGHVDALAAQIKE